MIRLLTHRVRVTRHIVSMSFLFSCFFLLVATHASQALENVHTFSACEMHEVP